MFKKIRITLAVLMFAAMTLLFLDFTGTLHAWLGWTAKIQFLPALLALNLGVVASLLVLTLVAGRVYCSVICPLGVMQDVITRLGSMGRKSRRYRFSYSPARKWLRLSVLLLFVLAIIFGIGSFVALLAPYSSYGRIVSSLLAPLYEWGNNLLAMGAERLDSYAFYRTDVYMRGSITFAIAAATFVVIFVLAWRNGRTYCNTICPVGTFLGFFSRFALFRPVIDKSKCVDCTLCSRGCKASCIDVRKHAIDYSRCVACMDCVSNCSHGALTLRYAYSRREAEGGEKAPDSSRRTFVMTAATVAATAAVSAAEKKVDGGMAVIEDKKIPERKTRIVPPGALGADNFAAHCTACQLCVRNCPTGVLRPSSDLGTLMQPVVEYERGYCRPECNNCSEVCPSGAIRPISVADKSSTRIGHAVWVRKNCLPASEGVSCGNCARHCPSGAISMVPLRADDPEGLQIPVVNAEKCIGCGACENLCPSRPFSAIYVEGHLVHSQY